MDYSPEAFEALIQEVENQGGAAIPDPCVPSDVDFTEADGYKKPRFYEGATCGCNNTSRLVSIYDHGQSKVSNGAGFAVLCAVCDSVGAHPRYIDVVLAADPGMDPIERDEEEDEADDA